ncbi:MAG: hypothetical protein ACOYML_11515 [Microthrixaceae bacterium]
MSTDRRRLAVADQLRHAAMLVMLAPDHALPHVQVLADKVAALLVELTADDTIARSR